MDRNRWVDGWRDVRIDGWIGIDGWMGRLINGLMGGWMSGLMDITLKGWVGV